MGLAISVCRFFTVTRFKQIYKSNVHAIRRDKRSWQQWLYFFGCFLQLAGCVLVVTISFLEQESISKRGNADETLIKRRDADHGLIKRRNAEHQPLKGLIIVEISQLVHVILFSLASFGTICKGICYVLTYATFITLAFFALNECNKITDVSEHFRVLCYFGLSLLLLGLLICFVMSVVYHWFIFRVGTDERLCCFIHCKNCACCNNCCLCCCERETRLHFNKVTLYHKTRAEAAENILKTQQMRAGTQGLAGAGIYFATKPPSTEKKARHIQKGDETVMLKATVRLGRVLRLDRDGITVMSEFGPDRGTRYNTNCETMATFLELNKHDSVWLPRDQAEFVVYDPAQVTDITDVGY